MCLGLLSQAGGVDVPWLTGEDTTGFEDLSHRHVAPKLLPEVQWAGTDAICDTLAELRNLLLI